MAEIVAMRQGSLKRKAFITGSSELQIDACEDSEDVHGALMTLSKEELLEPFVNKEVQAQWKLETEKARLMDLRFKDPRVIAATVGV